VFEDFSTPEVLIGVASFLATIFVTPLYRNRRKVFYDVISEFRLLDKESDCETKELVIAERSIQTNPKVFVIELNNHWGKEVFGMFGGLGNVDITPAHYERAVTLEFGNDAQILDAQIADETPPGIREIACVHRNKIMLKPVLLNHGIRSP
jgi:hypothetical protein